MKRRILAMVLACVMVFSLLPVMGFATTEEVCKIENHTLKNCPEANFVKKVDATCGEWGYTVYQCPDCGDYFADDFVKGYEKHETVVVEEAVAATCTEPGKTALLHCNVCNKDMGGEEIAPLGHEWSKEVVNTGDAEGCYATYKCLTCGETKTVEGEHTYGDMPVIEKEPTTTEDGIAVYTCEVCGEEKRVPIVCAHNDLEHVAEVPATCTEAGVKAHDRCKVCGKKSLNGAPVLDEKKLVIPALGHDFKNGEQVEFVDSTCSAAGHETRKCARCDVEQTTDIKMKEHRYAVEKKIEAKCETWGYEIVTCLDCGFYDFLNKTAPLGHIDTYEKALEAQKAAEKNGKKFEIYENPVNCETNGSYTWACRCGELFTEVVEATGCDLVTVTVEAVCSRYAYTFTYCARENCDCDGNCGEMKKDEAHRYSGLFSTVKVDGVDYDVTVNGKEVNLKSITVDKDGGYNPNKHTPHGNEYDIINAPTCTETGDRAYICKYCDHYTTETMPALGHKMDPNSDIWTDIIQYQSCTDDEIIRVWCTNPNCGHYEEMKTENTATGHDMVEIDVVAPTCSAKGYTVYECETCGFVEMADFVDPVAYKTEWTLEEAEAVHTLTNREIYREGNYCEILGLEKYWCADCGKYIFVVIEGTGNGHVKPDGLVTDCVTGYDCVYCGEHISEEHEWNSEVECQAECVKCGVVKNPDAHKNLNIVDSAEQSCTQFGYVHYDCPTCDLEYITNYVHELGHDWILVDEVVADCDNDGYKYYECSRCDETKEEIIYAFHVNAEDEIFYDACWDETEDRFCVICEKEIGKSHFEHEPVFKQTYPATCLDYGYIIRICVCGHESVEYINDGKLGEHLKSELLDSKPATHLETGWNLYWCDYCKSEWIETVDKLPGVGYLVSVDNALDNTNVLTDSSLVAVTITLSADKVDVWGFTFDLFYDDDVLDFVSAEFVSDAFITMPMAHDNGGYVSVVANTANDENKQPTTYTVDGNHEVVVLYFRVNLAKELRYADNTSFVRTDNILTLALEGKEVIDRGYEVEFDVEMLLDVNNDGDFNLKDAQIVYNMLIGASEITYDAVADVDKDGVITLADFEAIYKYLIGALKYEQVCALGVKK